MDLARHVGFSIELYRQRQKGGCRDPNFRSGSPRSARLTPQQRSDNSSGQWATRKKAPDDAGALVSLAVTGRISSSQPPDRPS
jgi:hypothetical protein